MFNAAVESNVIDIEGGIYRKKNMMKMSYWGKDPRLIKLIKIKTKKNCDVR